MMIERVSGSALIMIFICINILFIIALGSYKAVISASSYIFQKKAAATDNHYSMGLLEWAITIAKVHYPTIIISKESYNFSISYDDQRAELTLTPAEDILVEVAIFKDNLQTRSYLCQVKKKDHKFEISGFQRKDFPLY